MPIGPTTYFRKDRVFVDREPCIQAFRENIQKLETQKYNILFYYGIAGIGKSKLQKELQRILDEEYPEILWVSIDLNTKTYREVGTFLFTLRNKIQEKCKTKFYLFNTIHAIYWKKLHPEILLPKENYPLIKEDGFFTKIIDILNEIKPGPLEPIPVRPIFDIINNAPGNVKSFFKEQSIDIEKLTAMEAHELENLLPGFFAADFTSYLGKDSQTYIFIDTYEALWEGLRDKGGFHEKDAWIRENLIPNMSGVSWIICGREKLLWAYELDSDWEMYLEQHPVDELPESFCTEFLEDCSIENKDIRDVIIKGSEGIPYYLNLSVDTFEKIRRTKQPVPEDFGKTQPEIFNTFVKYLFSNEIRALEVLSSPNFWDRDIFEILMKKFDPGFPVGAFSELIKFSFIKTDPDGKYSLHQLMRKSLQEHQAETDRKNTHQFLFAYYSNKIKDIDIDAIAPEHEIELTEALYHAKESLETEELFNWFISASDPFNRAAFWKLTSPMYEEILQILEAKLEPEHPYVATALSHLAGLYNSMGNYDKARSLYQRVIEITEKALGLEHPFVAASLGSLAELHRMVGNYDEALPLYQRALDIYKRIPTPPYSDVAMMLNDLALLYSDMGNYDKALPLYQNALEIAEKEMGPQHHYVATVLHNLALLYYQMGYYDNQMGYHDKALPLYQRALSIDEKVLGPQHPSVATTLNNLAGLYNSMGNYDKALPLYQRVLEITEKVLGSEHPYVATTLNNLALLHADMGNHETALLLYRRALDLHEKIHDPQHPDIAATLKNLADTYREIGRFNESLQFYERSLDIIEYKLGTAHPYFSIIIGNLIELNNTMLEEMIFYGYNKFDLHHYVFSLSRFG